MFSDDPWFLKRNTECLLKFMKFLFSCYYEISPRAKAVGH